MLVRFVIALLALTPALAATRVSQPRTIIQERQSDGSWVPSTVTPRRGDTVKWTALGATSAVVRVNAGSGDPCDAGDKVTYGAITDEFTGPKRYDVPGIMILSGGADAVEQAVAVDCASCDNTGVGGADVFPCVTNAAETLEYCPVEDPNTAIMDALWEISHIGGAVLDLNWSDLETTDEVYDWDRIDEALDDAANNGKSLAVGMTAGQEGTPEFICDASGVSDIAGLNCVFTEDDTEGSPGATNCGADQWMGNPADAEYVNEVKEFWTAFFAHVNTDAAWRQAVTRVHLGGFNIVSEEAKLPHSCCDGDCGASTNGTTPVGCSCAVGAATPCDTCAAQDGILDRMNQDNCTCNPKNWADAGYTPDVLYAAYEAIGNHIQTVSGGVTMSFPLIHAGWPKVASAGSTRQDDLGGLVTARTIIDRGLALWPTNFMAMHEGIDPYPQDLDPELNECTWTTTIDTTPPERAVFPIPYGTDIPANLQNGCPNVFAVFACVEERGTCGWQHENIGHGFDSACDLESTLWNLTKNSNGNMLEHYAYWVWKFNKDFGSGGDLCPDRTTNPIYSEIPYTKSHNEWNLELRDRRERQVALNPNSHPDPYPTSHQWTFQNAGTYHLYDPSVCPAVGNAPRGIVVVQ
jgi:hypothetical protein